MTVVDGMWWRIGVPMAVMGLNLRCEVRVLRSTRVTFESAICAAVREDGVQEWFCSSRGDSGSVKVSLRLMKSLKP